MYLLSHQGYYEFLQAADVVGFLSQTEIEYIKSTLQGPTQSSGVPELMYHEGGPETEGSSDTYWPMQSDMAAPGLDLGWPLPQHSFIGPTEVTTLVNPSDPDMPSIKEQTRRLIKNARQVSKRTGMETSQSVEAFTLALVLTKIMLKKRGDQKYSLVQTEHIQIQYCKYAYIYFFSYEVILFQSYQFPHINKLLSLEKKLR